VMQSGEQVQVQIRDNGRGIPADVKLGTASTLGFQLLPLLAEQLKCTLTLWSGPGQGSCFTMIMPDLIRES
ncbi:MAG: ATP-binding protein, partial [Microvirgula sp.]